VTFTVSQHLVSALLKGMLPARAAECATRLSHQSTPFQITIAQVGSQWNHLRAPIDSMVKLLTSVEIIQSRVLIIKASCGINSKTRNLV